MNVVSKIERDTPAAPAPGKWEWAFKLAPVFLVIATGIFYLNGVAFRQGYLDHFHLQSSMFDDDVGSQVAFAVRGWQELSNMVLSGAWDALIHWAMPYLVVAIFLCWLVWKLERGHRARRREAHSKRLPINADLRRRAAKRRLDRTRPHPLRDAPLTRKLAIGLWSLWIGATVTFLVVHVMGVVLGVCVSPFLYAGKSLAIHDEKGDFADAPWVTVPTPEGPKVAFRLITCAPRFCALYSSDRIVTAPASAVTWLTNEAKPISTARPGIRQPAQPIQNPRAKSTS
jgi:hypothetical protein